MYSAHTSRAGWFHRVVVRDLAARRVIGSAMHHHTRTGAYSRGVVHGARAAAPRSALFENIEMWWNRQRRHSSSTRRSPAPKECEMLREA
ncbi:MAG: hypothetical protein JST16_14330 [Bdellovibrionales bacterium]|nr:hypothetical protein [Bdellovibrionales bacterium]